MRPVVDFLLPTGAMGSLTRANLRRCARYFKAWACTMGDMKSWNRPVQWYTILYRVSQYKLYTYKKCSLTTLWFFFGSHLWPILSKWDSSVYMVKTQSTTQHTFIQNKFVKQNKNGMYIAITFSTSYWNWDKRQLFPPLPWLFHWIL